LQGTPGGVKGNPPYSRAVYTFIVEPLSSSLEIDSLVKKYAFLPLASTLARPALTVPVPVEIRFTAPLSHSYASVRRLVSRKVNCSGVVK
jgi:hypothetical protein